VCRIQREFDVLRRRARDIGDSFSVDRARIGIITTLGRRKEFSTDEIIVSRLQASFLPHELQGVLKKITLDQYSCTHYLPPFCMKSIMRFAFE
jgi:hypothetical protein